MKKGAFRFPMIKVEGGGDSPDPRFIARQMVTLLTPTNQHRQSTKFQYQTLTKKLY